MRRGVINEPPPTPVIPTRKPTKKPDRTKSGWMVSNRAISFSKYFFGQGGQSNTKQVQTQSLTGSFAQLLGNATCGCTFSCRSTAQYRAFLTAQSRRFTKALGRDVLPQAALAVTS